MEVKEADVLEITVLAPEDSGIIAVAGIKTEFMEALKKAGSGSTIIFDLSNAQRVDSSLAQLIVAFEHEAKAKNCKTVIKDSNTKRSLLTMFCCNSIEGHNEEGNRER